MKVFERSAIAVVLLCSGCSEPTPPTPTSICLDDGDPRGPACATLVADDAAFDRLSLPVRSRHAAERLTKYLAPASGGQPPPALVQNVNRYPVHRDLMQDVLSAYFPEIDLAGYQAAVLTRATRTHFAGNLARFRDSSLGTFYGFTVYAAAGVDEQLDVREVESVYRQLQGVLPDLPLYYTFEPSDGDGPDTARNWIDPKFPIYDPDQDGVDVEVYTPGIAYGWVRVLTTEELNRRIAAGAIGSQDLVVVQDVPFDIETVIAGIVTGGRQWELSHVNVRMNRRGTPNLFIRDAVRVLEPYQGQLVRIQAFRRPRDASDRYVVEVAKEADAEAFWAEQRPDPITVPTIDRGEHRLRTLEQLAGQDATTTVGAKAANLADLYVSLPQRHRVPGFAIPFAYFEDALSSTAAPRMSSSTVASTLRGVVADLAADERMRVDVAYRRARLDALRQSIRTDVEIDAPLVRALTARIAEVFGHAEVKVRFRSSSNAEDDLEFSGAGLYDSTSVCAADSLDLDAEGPSRCDPSKTNERTIERGLTKVWASLYEDRAWEERDWYGIDQRDASMAVLVTLAFPDEKVNGVAFTGNIEDPADDRYLINAQAGDEPVVANSAVAAPEKDLLRIADGGVDRIFECDALRSRIQALGFFRTHSYASSAR